MPHATRQFKRFIPFFVLLAAGALLAYLLMDREWSQMRWEIPGTPNEYPLAQHFRPWLISIGCFLPSVIAFAYALMGIMDRYMTRLFLSSFFLCTGILSLIFILGDFAENAGDLSNMENPIWGSARFYLLQLPMILNLILPYTLMLGVLWTLSKLSASSELTGMLQSGRSLLRITSPILVGSCVVAIYFGIFGFHWAPNATLYRKLLFSSMNSNIETDPNALAIRYRNDSDNRMWNIRIPPGIDSPGAPLYDVHIEQFSEPGQVLYDIFAKRATWNPNNRTWTFHECTRRYHPPRTSLSSIPFYESETHDTLVTDFKETPWQLISPHIRNDAEGTPEIINQLEGQAVNRQFRLELLTELHVRIARIFSCIILAFIAIPSSITFQRRSVMTGIGIAIFLAASMLFLYEFFPTLSSRGYLPPWLGAWMPNIIYICIASYLFHSRLAMRSLLEWLKARKTDALIHEEARNRLKS